MTRLAGLIEDCTAICYYCLCAAFVAFGYFTLSHLLSVVVPERIMY